MIVFWNSWLAGAPPLLSRVVRPPCVIARRNSRPLGALPPSSRDKLRPSGSTAVLGKSACYSSVVEDGVSQRQIENTIPVLAVRDLDRSIAFFREVLGFELEWNAGSVCSVARDGCSIMLQVQGEAHPGTVWIGLDGDALFSRIQESDARILQPPSRRRWAHEMKIADPDGNVIWLGADPMDA